MGCRPQKARNVQASLQFLHGGQILKGRQVLTSDF